MNGAQIFGKFAGFAVAGAIIGYPIAGLPGVIGVAIGLYYVLHFCNALDSAGAAVARPKSKRPQRRKHRLRQ